MEISRNIEDLRSKIRTIRKDGAKIAFVPTMGALHSGHLSLVEQGLRMGCKVVASIFVNPTQFGPNEDLNRYPRQEKKDLELLEKCGASLVYLPTPETMYPEGFCSKINIGEMEDIFCGKFRPGHFSGVATVVAKLFMQVMPDISIFGEKDFQQLQVIKTVVRDLDMQVEIIGAPTMRESDGLAMSSRNTYLSSSERKAATTLYRVLSGIKKQIAGGMKNIDELITTGKNEIIAAGFTSIDYLALAESETLEELHHKPQKPARLLVAARIGNTRLIDNIEV